MNEEALSLVVGLNIAHEVWEALSNSFTQGSQEREFHMQQCLQLHRKGTFTLFDYIWDFKSICDDLAVIGKPVEDKKKVFWLHNGLGRDYQSFVTTMLKPPTPSYNEVITLLKSHETWNMIHCIENQSAQKVAFVGQHTNNGGKNTKMGTV